MANCPNCGSGHITLKRETNVSWGRAIAGWALFGVVGGAVGAVTGEDRNVNACLDCGTSWKAEALYRVIELIKNSTGIRVDLSKEQDRFYMNSFVAEVSPYLEAVSIAEKKAETLIKVTEQEIATRDNGFSLGGCLLSGAIFSACFSIMFSSFLAFILMTIIVITPTYIGVKLHLNALKGNKKYEQETIRAKIEADKIRSEAQDNLRFAIQKFQETY